MNLYQEMGISQEVLTFSEDILAALTHLLLSPPLVSPPVSRSPSLPNVSACIRSRSAHGSVVSEILNWTPC